MANAFIEFGEVMASGSPVYGRVPRVSENIATSTTTQSTTITANGGEYATVIAGDADIYVAIGTTPTAVAGQGRMVRAGMIRDFGPLKDEDKVAVIDR